MFRKLKSIWLTALTHIRKKLFFYFTVLFIVKISTGLMDYSLARCGRNLVLFCFYFSTAEITKDFRDSRCNFQDTYGLYLHIKLWSWFEIRTAIKTKGYTLNCLKKIKYDWKLNQLLYCDKTMRTRSQEMHCYWLDKWRYQKR